MDFTSAVVAVIVAVLAGGGIGALWTARANAKRIGTEGQRTTVETFSAEWLAIIKQLQGSLTAVDERHRECMRSLDSMMDSVRELRVEVAGAREVATMLRDRVAAMEDDEPGRQRRAVGEAVRQLGGLDPEQHGHDPAGEETT